MKMNFCCNVFIFTLFFLCSSAKANTLTLTEPNSNKSVGDQIAFSIVLETISEDQTTSGSETKWEFVPESEKRWLTWGGMLVDRESLSQLPSDSANIVKLDFYAIASDAGKFSVPAFSVRKKGGTYAYKIEPSISIDVSSTLSAEEQGKPQWTLGLMNFGGYSYFAIGIMALIFIGIMYFFIKMILKLWKSKKNQQTLNAKETALMALLDLQEKMKNKITTLQEWKKFAYALVEILKKYCENNFLFQTYDLTDKELIQQLHSYIKNKEEVKKLAGIFDELDQVRYGTRDLDIVAAPRLLIEAKYFVEKNYIDRVTKENGGHK